jgi:Pyrimidine dimer DNA glycosylase
VQTFLPYPDLAASARALDNRRLGKQRVETLQVMRALTKPGYGWQHHPVVAMWRGHAAALMAYQAAICTEWVGRGFADTCLVKTRADLDADPEQAALYASGDIRMPAWFGDPAFHASHRSNLLAKEPAFYAERFPDDVGGMPYLWPGESAAGTPA